MSTKSSVWDKILKVIIAVASALIGALSAHAMTCLLYTSPSPRDTR